MQFYKFWWRVFRDRNGKDSIIGRDSLLQNVSYLYPEDAKDNPFIGLQELRSIWNTSKSKKIPVFNQETLIFDRAERKRVGRSDYLRKIGISGTDFLAKSDLLAFRNILGLHLLLLNYFLGFIVAIIAIFKTKGRVNLALVIRAIFESHILLKILSGSTTTEIHDFVQYDVDSNALYLLLKEHFGSNILYFKYPSPGPLVSHNKHLLTDVLCINHIYHSEEVERFRTTMSFSKLKLVPPEGFFNYCDLYDKTNRIEGCGKMIGYYSHGGWIRQSSGHANDGLSIPEFEINLLSYLSRFLKIHPEVKLKVLLHPKEKLASNKAETQSFYDQFFQNSDQVVFSDRPSTNCFDEVDIGLGVYSTILFERLYCGFPTLIMSSSDSFPIVDSTLDLIMVTEECIDEKIGKGLQYSQREFFEKNNLTGFISERYKAQFQSPSIE